MPASVYIYIYRERERERERLTAYADVGTLTRKIHINWVRSTRRVPTGLRSEPTYISMLAAQALAQPLMHWHVKAKCSVGHSAMLTFKSIYKHHDPVAIENKWYNMYNICLAIASTNLEMHYTILRNIKIWGNVVCLCQMWHLWNFEFSVVPFLT